MDRDGIYFCLGACEHACRMSGGGGGSERNMAAGRGVMAGCLKIMCISRCTRGMCAHTTPNQKMWPSTIAITVAAGEEQHSMFICTRAGMRACVQACGRAVCVRGWGSVDGRVCVWTGVRACVRCGALRCVAVRAAREFWANPVRLRKRVVVVAAVLRELDVCHPCGHQFCFEADEDCAPACRHALCPS